MKIKKEIMLRKIREKLDGTQAVAAEMLARGETQQEVADYLGIDPRTLRRWRSGNKLFRMFYEILLKDKTKLAEMTIRSKLASIAETVVETALDGDDKRLSAMVGLKLLQGTGVLADGQKIKEELPMQPRECVELTDIERVRIVDLLLAKPEKKKDEDNGLEKAIEGEKEREADIKTVM